MSQPSTRSASPAAMRTAWMSLGLLRDAQVGGHGAALLRQAGLVEHGRALAFQMRGHADQRADRDDAGAADAGDEDVPGLREVAGNAGSRQVGETSRRRRPPCASAARRHATVTKLGQKPLTQEKSLLQLDWSISRLRPNSVSFGSTDTQNDFSPQSPQPSQTSELMNTRLFGSSHLAALAPAALFGRAGLVVDQHR